MINDKLFNDILIKVSKPSRYIGREINSVKKDFNKVDFKMVLSYPDLYDIGMSNLGIKYLYEIINSRDNMLCERVFMPWVDMVSQLRDNKLELCSLESGTPLKGFDIIGFSLQYELTFTNVLAILDLANIPLYSKDRDSTYPLVIAGGPCCYNPEPIADFIDLFVIGEGETAIIDIGNKFIDMDNKGLSKEDMLNNYSLLPGIYVPAKHNSNTKIRTLAQGDINKISHPIRPPVPYTQVTQDYGFIEVSRGCTAGCRFCQAGMIYRPVRERSINSIVNIAKSLFKNTGYREASLLSLSIADYSNLSELIAVLNNTFANRGISFSLPSLRIDAFTLDSAIQIKKVRKTGLTFAIEAASEHTRDVINKRVTEDKLLDIVKKVTKLGWKTIKLYFMIGLPSSSSNEENSIIKLVNKLLSDNRGLRINLNIGVFIPKSHTPFQWAKQITISEAEDKLNNLSLGLRNKRIKLKFHSPQMSLIEGLIARGDRLISGVIHGVYKRGAIFQGWGDHFNFSLWMSVLKDLNINIDDYIHKDIDLNSLLPWDHIGSNVDNGFLISELDKANNACETKDCRDKCYDYCGVCNKELKRVFDDTENNIVNTKDSHIDNDNHITVRIKFTKEGILRFLSHLELYNLIQRAVLRMDLPIIFSKGFNPIPKIEIVNPLPTGVESLAEYLQFKVKSDYDFTNFKDSINSQLPLGVQVNDFYYTSDKLPNLNADINMLEYKIYLDDIIMLKPLEERIKLLDSIEYIPSIKNGVKKDKLNLFIKAYIVDSYIVLAFKTSNISASLFDYLTFLFQRDKKHLLTLKIIRLAQFSLDNNNIQKEPILLLRESLYKAG